MLSGMGQDTVLERMRGFLSRAGYPSIPASGLEDLRRQLSDEIYAQALAYALGLPYRDLDADPPDPNAAHFIPRTYLARGSALPCEAHDNELVVAVADPLDRALVQGLRTSVRQPVSLVVAPQSGLRRHALNALGRLGRTSSKPTSPGGTPPVRGSEGEEGGPGPSLAPEPPPRTVSTPGPEPEELLGAAYEVERIVDTAINQGATDIHFEWYGPQPRVRIRVDGRLMVLEEIKPEDMPAYINVIKIRSNLDTSNRLIPQDGRWAFTSMDGQVQNDLRVSVIPTVYGEEAVLRVLPKPGVAPRLDSLGFSSEIAEGLRQAANLANGMVLVTGPTGSGKTTTLFALIGEILEKRNPKILSVEDPVEYRLPGVSQVQVNPAVGLGFARALRAFLRSDPDVILVGEIRDQESAKIATESAMTGHLVLGTLHTNSATQAPIRLMEMGLEPFKVADSLRVVLAQRLVPKLCTGCRVEDPEAKEYLVSRYRYNPHGLTAYRKGPGCPLCHRRGYRGRLAVHEILKVDAEVRRAIMEGVTSDTLTALLRPKGFRTLFEDGLERVAMGLISLEDLFYATDAGEEEML